MSTTEKTITILNQSSQSIHYKVWWRAPSGSGFFKQGGNLRPNEEVLYHDTAGKFNIEFDSVGAIGQTLIAQTFEVPLGSKIVWSSYPTGGYKLVRAKTLDILSKSGE